MKPPRGIVAVILTYHPEQGILRQAVASLCAQVEQILIVDNGARWDAAGLLAALEDADRNKIDFIWLERNIGVGAGHNRGIQWARARGFSHVLIMDHDSVPRPDMVQHLVAALERLGADRVPVSVVRPRYRDRYTGHMASFARLGRWWPERVLCVSELVGELLETDFIISSGSLIPMSVLQTVGDMNEGFFIDHVDTEWILRAKAHGYRSFGVCDAVMEHSVGYTTLRFWFLRWRAVPLHSPRRNYYLIRNSIALYRMPHAPLRWIMYDVARLVGLALVIVVVAPNSWLRLRFMARGIWDGLRRVSGPLV